MLKDLKMAALMFVAILAAGPAFAGEVHLGGRGSPSLTAVVPDDWIIGEEDGGIVNVADVLPPNVMMTFSLLRDSRSPDRFVAEEMQRAGGKVPTRTKEIAISGLGGWLFTATDKAPSGRELIVRHYVARLDKRFIIAVTAIVPSNGDEKYQRLAEAVVASVKALPR